MNVLVFGAMGLLYPLLRWLTPRHVTTAENLGRAMIAVAVSGYSKQILENRDIDAVGGAP